MKKTNVIQLAILIGLINPNINLKAQTMQYTMPSEEEQHEGTWLAWPHEYEYGIPFRNENDLTWVAMTNALQANEKVHIIAYDINEQTRITNLLNTANVPLININFVIAKTNDVWARDMASIFVRNSSGTLVMQDWGFNGWGGDYNFNYDNIVPTAMGTSLGMTPINLNGVLTVEGGAYEIDGNGAFLATKSSILTQTNPTTPTGIKAVRNLGKTQTQVELIFKQNIGVTKFIWLDGWFSKDDITDAHIDGFAKFAPGNKLVTMNQADLLYWGMSQADINTLYAASNASNVVYSKVFVPLTLNNVSKTNGTSLGYKGSYANYYVANNLVLVPNYNDPNDATANGIIGALYPGRTVVGIDVRNLYGNGGMVHCVTQQQPVLIASTNQKEITNNGIYLSQIAPNPFNSSTIIQLNALINDGQLIIYDVSGQQVKQLNHISGKSINLKRDELSSGIYFLHLSENNTVMATEKIIITD
jgi:agmatine deiminase